VTFLNYAVDPEILSPWVPPDTVVDLYRGSAWLSLVGLVFRNTRVLGIQAPYQQNYPQLNLRFCVRRRVGHRWRRGIVFLKQLAPSSSLALAARWLYNERYSAVAIGRKITSWNQGMKVEYSWIQGAIRDRLAVTTVDREPKLYAHDSFEEFITYRLWGYTPQRNGSTVEIRTRHPHWACYRVDEISTSIHTDALGGDVASILSRPPDSAFVAEGSRVMMLEVDQLSPPDYPLTEQ
jgi:uncharacterized protein YqjF (DUF2071 family)